jgi:hypothetical protein
MGRNVTEWRVRGLSNLHMRKFSFHKQSKTYVSNNTIASHPCPLKIPEKKCTSRTLGYHDVIAAWSIEIY